MPLPQMHGRTHCPGGSDPLPCFGTPFCYAETSAVSVSGSLNSFNIADFGTGTNFKTNSSSVLPSVYHDTGKTPTYGIRIPANFLVLVNTWLWIASDIADGAHNVGWVIDGSYTVSHFGIADDSSFTSSASSASGLADDRTAPEGLFQVAYMGDTTDFTVGTIHDWTNWTTDPLFFKYGISVSIIGALPV